mmetsp:Transcript_3989/g.15396  ORF Transcript_3989/g.15396 Transcript_3989/m.15396 type:complete len:236 (-) Transcript_3989:932-1639(-)
MPATASASAPILARETSCPSGRMPRCPICPPRPPWSSPAETLSRACCASGGRTAMSGESYYSMMDRSRSWMKRGVRRLPGEGPQRKVRSQLQRSSPSIPHTSGIPLAAEWPTKTLGYRWCWWKAPTVRGWASTQTTTRRLVSMAAGSGRQTSISTLADQGETARSAWNGWKVALAVHAVRRSVASLPGAFLARQTVDQRSWQWQTWTPPPCSMSGRRVRMLLLRPSRRCSLQPTS